MRFIVCQHDSCFVNVLLVSHKWCFLFTRVYFKNTFSYGNLQWFRVIFKKFDLCFWFGHLCSNLQFLSLLFQSLFFLHILSFSHHFSYLDPSFIAQSNPESLWPDFECLMLDFVDCWLLDLPDSFSFGLENTAVFLEVGTTVPFVSVML